MFANFSQLRIPSLVDVTYKAYLREPLMPLQQNVHTLILYSEISQANILLLLSLEHLIFRSNIPLTIKCDSYKMCRQTLETILQRSPHLKVVQWDRIKLFGATALIKHLGVRRVFVTPYVNVVGYFPEAKFYPLEA
ncbi:hypothetical protein BG006_007784 [Podila minutissima]|uniref:Uncharacterized protein n=1 Tax=Podila minutissima TaxID=64525 RepID=A0A9P5SGS8_9FUNG|nr:hypothetical protein BG006_007784 [Podila minutissima]